MKPWWGKHPHKWSTTQDLRETFAPFLAQLPGDLPGSSDKPSSLPLGSAACNPQASWEHFLNTKFKHITLYFKYITVSPMIPFKSRADSLPPQPPASSPSPSPSILPQLCSQYMPCCPQLSSILQVSRPLSSSPSGDFLFFTLWVQCPLLGTLLWLKATCPYLHCMWNGHPC